jgi:hypothetical protein
LRESIDRGGAFSSAVIAGEEPVFTTQCQRPDGALSSVVADVETTWVRAMQLTV